MKSLPRIRVFIAVSLLLGASACGGTETSQPEPGSETATSGGDRHKLFNVIPCAEESDGTFTSPITDVATTHSIFPPGGAAGYEIKPHGYFLIKGERAAIYAPTDMELVQGSWYKEPEQFEADTTYILHFSIGCDFALFIDHITDPVERIKAVLNTEPREDARMDTFLDQSVTFKAGELIGYTIGGGPKDSVHSWDFGYYNAAVTNEYANQERRIRSYAWKQLHAVCGFDYFPEPIRTDYLRLFTTRAGKFVPDAGCRSPNRDVIGTLSGSWYFTPEAMSIDPHVAIAGDIDGASLTLVGLQTKGYLSIGEPNPTYKDPATVTDRHCYVEDGDTSQYFYFVLVDDMTLDLYEGSGPCPSEPQGTKITLYR